MANQKIRIKLKAYEHNLIDQSAERIVETAKRPGAKVSGPIPLPTEKEVVTILRAVHKYKDSREQFERRTHKRLIDIMNPTQKTVESLMSLELPAGVEIEINVINLADGECGHRAVGIVDAHHILRAGNHGHAEGSDK